MRGRKWTAEEKLATVLEGIKGATLVAEICREHRLAQIRYYQWRDRFLEGGKRALTNGLPATEEALHQSSPPLPTSEEPHQIAPHGQESQHADEAEAEMRGDHPHSRATRLAAYRFENRNEALPAVEEWNRQHVHHSHTQGKTRDQIAEIVHPFRDFFTHHPNER